MAKKKITRKDLLKETDEFLSFSGRAINFFTAHQVQLKYAGMGIGVVILIYAAVYMYLGHVNKKGQEAYDRAYYSLSESLKPGAGHEDLMKSGTLFQEVMDRHGLSEAARLSLPQLAYVKAADKKYDEAIALYQEFLDDMAGDQPYESLARLAMASCYEATGRIKTAIETLNPIMEDGENPLKEAAMLSLARLHRLDQNPGKAKEILKTFVEKYKDSPFLPMAKAGLY
ncbi:MAG: tetratricopeptide repeat protein [Desulfatiglans sp.]|jgi:predicted negative regulator of RcsB-dependent stress response|nr:tetratricopeptide repeat protein [Thermodesulfobacteriota bacterium]MEE4354552.1 tetratricopeptide repeat protein [Desulfatiglans sp.]